MNADTIPVIAESRKEYAGFEMTRCNYLTVECEETSLGWGLTLEDERSPIILVGLSAIITSPTDRSRFEEPENIEKLIEAIEKKEPLFIDVNDIWLPNFLLDSGKGSNQGITNEVYRIRPELFSTALKFRNGELSIEGFINSCSESINAHVKHSPEESDVFRKWHWEVVDQSRELYRERKEQGRVLKRKNKDAPKGPGR